MGEHELAAELLDGWREQADDRIDLLRRLVDINSHSDNVDGIDRLRAELAPEVAAAGFEVTEPAGDPEASETPRGAHLIGRRGGADGAPSVLLIAHLDTVFPPGDGAGRLKADGELLWGPGVGDIKGGIVSILTAVSLLDRLGLGDRLDLRLFMNSDEEVGSLTSREIVRDLASGCRWALGFEPAFHPPGESVARHATVQHVVERKGCGRFAFELQGTAAHSGGAHHLGASAIEALARKVVDVHALTDHERGVTTNVGLVSGGRSVNTVAPRATGEIDFRHRTTEDGEGTAAAIRAILERPEDVSASAPPVTARVRRGGGVLWPPLVPTDASRRLSALVGQVSAELGARAEGISRGGASDAAHAAAAGVPAICGLGPVTHGIHTDEEHTSREAVSFSARAAAALLVRLADGG